ncbi:hypothetical protein [Flavobacterium sp. N1994]|uniref:hypothetical protein n=1 Tax=Flavobacterium sp. N1994 TaxID=2986827 RepID=UPI002221E0BF|nr:hypothetical protein [Flavobacterium sp. N1994]
MKQPIYSPEFLIEMANKSFQCDVMSSNRKRANVYGRMAISYYLRTKRGMTLQSIASIFNKDHASINHYIHQHRSDLKFDPSYRALFENFELEINGSFSVETYTIENCKRKIKNINRDLIELGYSASEIEAFWKECINEVVV